MNANLETRLNSGKMTRRAALRLGATGAVSALLGQAGYASVIDHMHILAGAIRWDAWDAVGSQVMSAVESTLGPHEYEVRAPFCAAAPSPDSIKFAKCDTQAVMDEEIAYAANAGLAYWAYCWYAPSDPMMNAWALHQSSAQRNRINWCMILQFSRVGVDFNNFVATYVGYFRQTNYQKVSGGRPLLYLFIDQPDHLTRDFGGIWSNVKKGFDALSDASVKAGLARPYLVVMAGYPPTANDIRKQLGGDAISNYMARVPDGKPASFEALTISAKAYWAEMAATGSPVIPICLTGWDTRPRKHRPPFWGADKRPDIDMDAYVVAGTPTQIAAQAQDAVDFVKIHADICPARAILIYSWNECDEGGSALVPTYTASGPNHAILDSVGAVLRKS